MPIRMTPITAVTLARTIEQQTHFFDGEEHRDYLSGLAHAKECMEHMAKTLRHIREKLPSREPELRAMITSALLRGCDLK